MNEIVFSSATQVAAAIRAREVSASDVLEAYLAQIATHNPALNAVVTLDAEHASGHGKRMKRSPAARGVGRCMACPSR